MPMNKTRDEFQRELVEHDVLFSCEGTHESVIIEKLCESGRLIVPEERLVRDMDGNPYTADRKAKDIERDFLGIDYPHGLLLVRIVDVNPGAI